MIPTKPTLEWHCRKCNETKEFRYVSSHAPTAGRSEQHYYTCGSGCGTSYEEGQMLSISNARRLYDGVTTSE